MVSRIYVVIRVRSCSELNCLRLHDGQARAQFVGASAVNCRWRERLFQAADHFIQRQKLTGPSRRRINVDALTQVAAFDILGGFVICCTGSAPFRQEQSSEPCQNNHAYHCKDNDIDKCVQHVSDFRVV